MNRKWCEKMNCDRKKLTQFLSKELDIDNKLDFLFHLDDCTECWEEVYNVIKAQHPHYYKSKARRMKISEKEIAQFDKEGEVFEVA